MYKLQAIEEKLIKEMNLARDFPEVRPGDVVNVSILIKEGNNERVQSFQGLCIGKKGQGINKAFMVRRNIGKESIIRTFPWFSPILKKIEILARGKVHKAKLYYMIKLFGKKARIKPLSS